MKIGIIIAIERELISFIESGNNFETIEISNKTVYKSVINGHEVFAVKSGCGSIDAAAATQLLISHFGCNTILNFGVVGALDKSLKVNDLFIVTKARHYQFDVSSVDPLKFNQYVEFEDEFIPLDKNLIETAKKLHPELKDAVAASGDRFVVDKDEKLYLNSLGCNICEMEIAAIARVSYLSGARCLSIKCISDTFDGDGGDFMENVIRSANKAFVVLHDILNNI